MTEKYPKGLFFLFATEMWERFSFYGISAVLVLYLTTRLGLPDKDAALASGAYMAFTFMSPILGGFIADKLLGLRYSVSFGGVLILIGNLILAWREELSYVFSGLACVALGTGYLKSTVSVMVGKLYAEGDSHRDSGYTLFYMGINVGALMAGVMMAWVARNFGWHNCFYLSSGGMFLGLIAFQLGYPHYNNDADGFNSERLFGQGERIINPELANNAADPDVLMPQAEQGRWSRQDADRQVRRSPTEFIMRLPVLFRRVVGFSNIVWLILGTLCLGALVVHMFSNPGQTKLFITYISIAIIVGIFLLAFFSKDKKERDSIFAILIIILAAICFQSFFKQMYNSLTLFVDRDFNKVLFGVPLDASFFSLVPNSLAVIIFAGLFTWLWGKLADRGLNPSIPMKIVFALCCAVASSALLAWVAHGIAASGQKASAWWIVLAIWILTLGELNILPMGLSAVSTLAPKRYSSVLMGAWFLGTSLGGYFSGFLTSLASVEKEKVDDIVYTATVYSGLYWKCSVVLGVAAVVMFITTPLMKKLMTGAGQ
ncbi:MAG: peptide MFS transporter [Candidatus Riflebacteria bacterium]|nr:peptide MFS transporter [Candidatus Riflebacteria bacterium]